MIPLFENIKKMGTGKIILRSILYRTNGTAVEAKEISKEHSIAPNALSNIAKKLESLDIIVREKKGKYIPRIGFILAQIIEQLMDLEERINALEKAIKKK